MHFLFFAIFFSWFFKIFLPFSLYFREQLLRDKLTEIIFAKLLKSIIGNFY